MTLKSLAAIAINSMTAQPARNFLNASYVNVKCPRDNKGEPVSRCMPTLLSRSSQAHDASNIREP